MAHPSWNDSYASGVPPWDTGKPEPELQELFDAGTLRPQRTLEVGCGTGTNAIWLSQRGFEVVGVDLAPLAVEQARAKDTGHRCRFEALDFLRDPCPGAPFDFAFDRGVFHVVDERDERRRFAAQVVAALKPGGRWLSLVGSTEGPPRDVGPPRRSAREIVEAIEPELEILELVSVEFRDHGVKAWRVWARRRDPAPQ